MIKKHVAVMYLFTCGALLVGCSRHHTEQAFNPGTPTITANNNQESEYPTVFTPVMDQLKNSAIPVYLPKIVPDVLDKNTFLDVNLNKILPTGYSFTLFSNVPGKDYKIVTDGSQLVTFAGTTDIEASTTYYDRTKNNLNHQEKLMLDGTEVTHFYGDDFPKVNGSDLIMWQDKAWQVIASGQPQKPINPEKAPASYSTPWIADYILKNFDLSGTQNKIKKGYIEGMGFGSRALLTIAWTSDGKTWYSVEGYRWDYIIKVFSEMVPLK